MTSRKCKSAPRKDNRNYRLPSTQHRSAFFCFANLLSRSLAALILISFLLFSGGFLLFVHLAETYSVDETVAADGIVVLTGGSQRIADAAALLAAGRAKRMLITGVHESTSRAAIATSHPLIASEHCCVDLGYRALNTVGNAIETRRWAKENKFQSLIVVTSTYHMPRTLLELGHALPGIKLLPYPVIAGPASNDVWLGNTEAIRFLMWEYIKYLAAVMRTTIESDPEHSPLTLIFGRRKPLT